MKRPFSIFLFVLSLLPLATAAQTNKQITLTYSQDDFVLDYDSLNQLAIYSYKHLSSFDEDTLKPALPYIAAYVMIGKNQNYNGFSYTSTELSVLNNVTMAPNPIAVPTSMLSTAPMGTMSVSFPNTLYPDSNVVYTGTHLMDGCKMLSFLICPYKYNNVNHTLSFVSEFNINISLTTETAPPPSLTVTRKRMARQIAHSMATNNNETDSLFNTIQETPDPADHCEYLIITCDSLVDAFQPLADWKTQKGVKAEIVTVEDIYSTYNEPTPQLKIKRCIKDYRDNKNLQYVLLGGDDTVVPAQGCYANNVYFVEVGKKIKKEEIEYIDMPADMFYGCLQGGFDWNSNGNDITGETTDNIELVQDVYVSRIPIRNKNHVEIFTQRITNYEQFPPLENWRNDFLMSGMKMSETGDAQSQGERLFNYNIAPFWNGSLVRYFDTINDMEPEYSTFNPSNILYHMSKGFPFVHMITHGNQDTWKCSNTPNFKNTDAAQLNNSFPTILSSIACVTNAFDSSQKYPQDPCLSEAFIRNPNSGILAYIGCTREGWFSTFYNYFSSFYRELFSEEQTNKCLGRVLNRAKGAWIAKCEDDGAYRWIQFGLCLMGDPEMPVFINQPLLLNNANISLQNGNVVVNTGVDSCRVCVMSLEDKGATYYNVVDSVNTVTFNDIPVTSTICITKQGYVPKIFKLVKGNHLYIQDETFEDDVIIDANCVDAGHDVTTEKSEGPVVIENGADVKMHGTNGVYIKNSFEVKKGATLEIK